MWKPVTALGERNESLASCLAPARRGEATIEFLSCSFLETGTQQVKLSPSRHLAVVMRLASSSGRPTSQNEAALEGPASGSSLIFVVLNTLVLCRKGKSPELWEGVKI